MINKTCDTPSQFLVFVLSVYALFQPTGGFQTPVQVSQSILAYQILRSYTFGFRDLSHEIGWSFMKFYM